MQRFEVPEIPLSRLVLWTLGASIVIGAFWLLVRFHDVVLLLLTAIIVSTAITPLVQWLEARGVGKTIGILLVLGALVLLLGLLVWFALPVFAHQGTAIAGTLDEGYQFLRDGLQRLPNILIQRLLIVVPEDLTSLQPAPGELNETSEAPSLAETLAQARVLFENVFPVIVAVLLTVYWTLEGERIRQAAFLLVPIQKRGDARDLVRDINVRVRGYLAGQGLLSLSIGLLAFVAYTVIGLPNALLLATFAGLMEAVPIIGPLVGAVPAIVVALSISPATALWVIVATGIIQQLENTLLVPRVMNRRIGVSPLVTLLSLLAFGSLFGVWGALIALPLAAVIQLLLERFLLEGDSLAQVDAGRDRLSVLRYETNQLVQDLRNQIRNKESVPSAGADALEDEVEAIALDLESFLAALEETAS